MQCRGEEGVSGDGNVDACARWVGQDDANDLKPSLFYSFLPSNIYIKTSMCKLWAVHFLFPCYFLKHIILQHNFQKAPKLS